MEADDRSSIGSNKPTYVSCPKCDHKVQLLDRKFLSHGPVRCGACGSEVGGLVVEGALARILESALETGSSS